MSALFLPLKRTTLTEETDETDGRICTWGQIMGSFWFSWHMTSATTGKSSECPHFLLAPELEFLRELVLSRLQEWVVSGVEGERVNEKYMPA